MTIDRNKYITFKSCEFDKWLEGVHDMDVEQLPLALEDAVVIRRQDVFAAPALYAYASTILSCVELMEAVMSPQYLGKVSIGDTEPMVRIDQLRELADFFAGEADTARQVHGKVPTP